MTDAVAVAGSSSLGVVGRALIVLIRGYQALRVGRLSPCRYWPTCSAYAIEAIQVHGTGRGSSLALRRIGRCHPWGGKGIDPVPEREELACS